MVWTNSIVITASRLSIFSLKKRERRMADTILIIAIDTKLIMENHCKRLKDFIFLAEAIYGTGRLVYFILKYTIYFLLATDKKGVNHPSND